jgi:hypothetical protein
MDALEPFKGLISYLKTRTHVQGMDALEPLEAIHIYRVTHAHVQGMDTLQPLKSFASELFIVRYV